MKSYQVTTNPFEESNVRHWAWHRGYTGQPLDESGSSIAIQQAHYCGVRAAEADKFANEAIHAAEIDLIERAIVFYESQEYCKSDSISLSLVLRDVKRNAF